MEAEARHVKQARHRNRLDDKLGSGAPLLVCYFPVGDPLMPAWVLDVYATAGVDVVELGLPTDDPFLDGEDITAAIARARAAGGDFAKMAEIAAAIFVISPHMAAICMSYPDLDLSGALRVGAWRQVHGLLVPGVDDDLRRKRLEKLRRQENLRQIVFVPAGTPSDAVEAARGSDGYIMLQASSGPTGPRPALDVRNKERIRTLRQAGVRQPILLGFGISTAEQARQAIKMGANGVIIGSMCLQKIFEGRRALGGFLTDVRTALDEAHAIPHRY